MNHHTVRAFSRSIMHGSKFVYQTIPRMLTIWLDLGEDARVVATDSFKKITEFMANAIQSAPAYKVHLFLLLTVPWTAITPKTVVYSFSTNCFSDRPR